MRNDITKLSLPELLSLKAKVELALIEELFQTVKSTQKPYYAMVDPPKVKPSNGNGHDSATPRKSLKGSKVPPKYRDPKTGITWSGRGVRPKWVRPRHLIAKAA